MYFGNLGAYVPFDRPFGNHPTLHRLLLAYWRMEESSGTRFDAHANHLDFAVLAGTPGYTPGKHNRAVVLSTGNSGSLRVTTSVFSLVQPITISMWVNAPSTDVGNFFPILSAGDYEFRFDEDTGYTAALYDDAAGETATNTVTGTANTWNHWFILVDPTAKTIKLQVNNSTSSTSDALAGTVRTSATTFTLSLPTGSDYIWVDEMGVWGRLLTLDERSDLYASGAGLYY